jgi:ribosomal protein S27AE
VSTPPPASQRSWRAACPNCGAPVDFRSPASASAVCSFCRSTLLRDGPSLRRIGQSAELFDDFTPLQLGASGRHAGEGFTLVGRLQFGTEDGPWNEWRALFDNGRDGWLSEDNGRYVFAFDRPAPPDAPDPARLQPGLRVTVDGRAWNVGSRVQARLLAAEGELREPPPADRPFTIVDLRNEAGEVATLDASRAPRLQWSVGRSVQLSELGMQGLREVSEKTLQSQAPACPNCGAPLAITLSTSQSVVCGQCKSVVDLSRGIGPDMAHYAQENRYEPEIPIGATGMLPTSRGATPLPWTVVGYMERLELGDDVEAWREYLLYNRNEGFAFLVDTNEEWSLVRTLTGAPRVAGDRAHWAGRDYARRWTYDSVVTYVLGEFYWRVEANQRTHHQDFEASAGGARALLSLERTAAESLWSAGETLPAELVAQAFRLAPRQAAQLQRAGRPAGGLDIGGYRVSWLMLLVLLVVVVLLLAMCSHDGCAGVRQAYGEASPEYRQCRVREAAGTGYYAGTGGAWGGYSSGGGGHK